MADEKVLRELAAEITNSLLSMLPGTSLVMQVLPDSSKSVIRKLFGAERAATLEAVVKEILEGLTDDLLAATGAERGSHEYGATFSAIEDFKVSLARTSLDGRLILDALSNPENLTRRLRENCPEEHRKWASDLRRSTYDLVLDRFSAALLAIAPQVATVQTAIAVETYRLVSTQQRFEPPPAAS